ncbi:hypothetical protein [Vibrio proteolyticus]
MSRVQTVKRWPKWGKIAAGIGLIASILGIIGFLVQFVDRMSDSKQKQDKFDAAYKRAWDRMGDEFMSSHNYLLSVIPQNIYQTSDADHWQRVSYSWNKHMRRMSEFYSEVSKCLEEQECEPGKTKERACSNAIAELKSHEAIHEGLEQIQGINMDYTGGSSPFGSTFGPSVSVPSARNLEIFVKQGCS